MPGVQFAAIKVHVPKMWTIDVSLPPCHFSCLFFWFRYVCLLTRPLLASCSLPCTQSHKPSCTPKTEPPSPHQPRTSEDGLQNRVKEENPPSTRLSREDDDDENIHLPRFEDLAASDELRCLFETHPTLRQRLREIYHNTLEEEWSSSLVEQERGHARRGRGSHRGRGGHLQQNRGAWNADKGFKRGLGRVRKWRESCEKGISTGSDAEGFIKFVALVNGHVKLSNSKHS